MFSYTRGGGWGGGEGGRGRVERRGGWEEGGSVRGAREMIEMYTLSDASISLCISFAEAGHKEQPLSLLASSKPFLPQRTLVP